jgi:DNA-binding NarL/FixJ family response regulator
MLHIALLDDHPAVVAGLRRLIDPEPDLSVVASGSNPADLARQLEGQHADVLVVDHDRADGDGLASCQRLKARAHPPVVIIYSAYAGPGLVLAARAARADAVVDKAAPVHALLSTIRAVAQGEATFPPVPRDAYESAVAKLDDEDLPVFAMLLDREPVEAIAAALRADRDQIAWRVQRIVGRLAPSRARLARAGPGRHRPATSRPG